jgi:hypothetical protein
MTFHKYMNPMLLLQNQLIDPFLWNPVPFLLYHCLHFCLSCRGLLVSETAIIPTLVKSSLKSRGRNVEFEL